MKAYILLDRSGSMATQWEQAVGAVNTYITNLSPDYLVHFAMFDSNSDNAHNGSLPFRKYSLTRSQENDGFDYHVVYEGMVKDFKPVDYKLVTPRGGTPLYQAAYHLFDMVNQQTPEGAVIIFMTDGEENSSRSEFTQTGVKSMMKIAEDKGYSVVFLGANFDVDRSAQSVGVSNFATVTVANYGSTMRSLAAKTKTYSETYGMANSSIAAATMSFSEQEKKDAVK